MKFSFLSTLNLWALLLAVALLQGCGKTPDDQQMHQLLEQRFFGPVPKEWIAVSQVQVLKVTDLDEQTKEVEVSYLVEQLLDQQGLEQDLTTRFKLDESLKNAAQGQQQLAEMHKFSTEIGETRYGEKLKKLARYQLRLDPASKQWQISQYLP
ncbi:hypothetical protein [Rheinheimera sp.]|uniref:hypothetical protein n=1 Tax=Rheinheimera sp. TaxID=1869214 RepID=UPI00307EB164